MSKIEKEASFYDTFHFEIRSSIFALLGIMKEALLEIGTEELPASFIPTGMKQLESLAQAGLTERGLSFTGIAVYGTPRRLAIIISGLADRSPDQKRIVTGPPLEKAKDPAGEWTPAALGFAKKQGLAVDALTIENGKLAAVLHTKGLPARQLLAELFPQWIARLEFPKSMIWEPSHFRFPRPIRWLAALYGTEIVSFSVAGVRSGRLTLGLPWVSNKKITLTQPGKYVTLLKNQCVSVDPSVRQDAIKKLAEQAVKRIHGHALLSETLLEQVSFLVENPVAVLGNFDASYLDLPREVLVTCLEHHQKFFPVSAGPNASSTSGDGLRLLAHFVGIRNGMSLHQDIVKEGYERVLAARLADARFFYNQDRRTRLEGKVESLRGVMFQQKLGTLFDKKNRVKQGIESLAALIPNAEWKTRALRTAELGKADLVTDMVREFPELQGVMARIYAGVDGEDLEVSQALEQHYWPITLGGRLPQSDTAAAVALVDKLDTLAGDFAIGLIPTGSADPYGLRRAAVGVLRILEDRTWSIDLKRLLSMLLDLQPATVLNDKADVLTKLTRFFYQRFTALLEERGFRPDEIEAVLSADLSGIPDALERLRALHDLRKKPEFEPLAVAFKRGMNIVRQAIKNEPTSTKTVIQSSMFKEPCEDILFQALEKAARDVAEHISAHAYRQALESMVSLREPLDGFFNGVMVMAEDPALRANRLALMHRLVGLFSQIADFTQLQHA